ncbi:hypothetical protein OIU84_020515 [Salix udensis]|uniref:Uncharacterized protein n=1 Tax=Salix udensis TaxID=889485 RepID=A0AAD6PGE6_9ROSI|nr:hypothetical protein OIU84_020515 [Salix udensis]
MISLRSLHKRLQGSLGITRSLPLRLGRSRLQLDWYCLESLRNMPFLKGLRLLPNLPALRRLGFVGFWMIDCFTGCNSSATGLKLLPLFCEIGAC